MTEQALLDETAKAPEIVKPDSAYWRMYVVAVF